MPSTAHRVRDRVAEIPLDQIAIGDRSSFTRTRPAWWTAPVGRSSMNEAYLTGEPYRLPKAPGSPVLSGAINADGVLTIRAEKLARDSRYARIMEVLRESEQHRPRLRRIADQLGTIYTPIALVAAGLAWWASGDAVRFLAVLGVATPCPLLIAIPVAVVGTISLAARRGIVVRDPAALERVDTCRTAIFDKTGTLTYGQPELVEILPGPGFAAPEVLGLVAALERYSRHPLAAPVLEAARRQGIALGEPKDASERPGEGLVGRVGERVVRVTGRAKLTPAEAAEAVLPPSAPGLECVVLVDGKYAAVLRFRDELRLEGAAFVRHLDPRHGFRRVLLVSGDRASEVEALAEQTGIREVHSRQTPEQKLALVRAETLAAPTLFVGDGINDAPALAAATVGIAFGRGSDVTSEAAPIVVLDTSLQRVDEVLHLGRRMRAIAFQSAIGGMVLSLVAMAVAATGHLPPVAGALTQEAIDVLAIANALRASFSPRTLDDIPS
jgi:heavy metal translocating P-type ATPase